MKHTTIEAHQAAPPPTMQDLLVNIFRAVESVLGRPLTVAELGQVSAAVAPLQARASEAVAVALRLYDAREWLSMFDWTETEAGEFRSMIAAAAGVARKTRGE